MKSEKIILKLLNKSDLKGAMKSIKSSDTLSIIVSILELGLGNEWKLSCYLLTLVWLCGDSIF